MKSKIMSVNQNNGKNDKGKICLIDILSWKQVLGTKVFGFLLLCSFAVVLAACGGVEVTAIEPFEDTDKDGVIDSRDSCPELANEGIDTDEDGIDDVCDTDDDGDDVVDEKDNCPKISNPLQGDVCEDDTSPAQGCTTQVRNFCELAEADYGSNRVGTCEDTYAGECAYTCNDDGEWEKLVNSCLADADGDKVPDDTDVDSDGDGLIEIQSEEMLGNIRYNLLGTGYKTSEQDPGDTNGCGGGVDDNGNPITVCKGYELVPDGGGDTITLTENWIPIVGDFAATFDGNGNTIKSLTIVGTATGANDETLGFFTYIGSGGIVQNLTIEEVSITATATGLSSDSESRTGSLVGELKAGGQIDGVKIINTDPNTTGISVSADRAGGLVGFNSGSITNSYATGSVSGHGGVGGLVGRSDGGTITNSYATGSVSGSANAVGGLLGTNNGAIITNSYSTASVSGDGSVGGLVGVSSGNITNSYSTGSVRGHGGVGGLVGRSDSATITNSYSTGSVTGTGNSVGGLVGKSNGGTITNSYSTGSVSGSEHVGGLVGQDGGGTTITKSYSTGSVTGSSNVGGLVGERNSGSITESYVHSTYTGRLVGNLETDPTGVSKEDLTGLTSLGTGWSENDWAFADNKFPTLRSYVKDANDVQEEGEILCGQDGDFNKDNVIDWVAPPAGQCGSL